MDVERELAALEQRLASEDPELARELEPFHMAATPPPRRRSPRRLTLLLAVIRVLLAIVSALAVDSAAIPSPPAGRVVQQHPGGPG